MKYLQVKIDNKWQYVFCRDPINNKPVITNNKKNAIREKYKDGKYILEYFMNKMAKYEFRIF